MRLQINKLLEYREEFSNISLKGQTIPIQLEKSSVNFDTKLLEERRKFRYEYLVDSVVN